MFIGHLYIYFGNEVFCPCFGWVVYVFSMPVDFHTISLLMSSCFSFWWCLIYYYFFMVGAFWVLPRIFLPTSRWWRYSPLLSFRSFIILAFAFRSVIHFKLRVDESNMSWDPFYSIWYPVVPTPFVEDCLFHLTLHWDLSWKSIEWLCEFISVSLIYLSMILFIGVL